MSPALAGGFLTTVPPGKSSTSLFFKIILALIIHIFHMNSRIILSVSTKNLVLNLYINLGRIDIFTMLSVLIHRQGMSFHLLRSSSIPYIQCFTVFSIQVLNIFC